MTAHHECDKTLAMCKAKWDDPITFGGTTMAHYSKPDSTPTPDSDLGRAYAEGRPVSAVFNGTYTITNKETGEYRTFRIRTQGADSNFAPGKRVLSLLTGPDNTRDYTGFGFLVTATLRDGEVLTYVRVWKAAQNSPWMGYVKLVNLVLILKDPSVLDKYSVEQSCRCIRCNRKLTTPESIKAGIGPICAGRE